MYRSGVGRKEVERRWSLCNAECPRRLQAQLPPDPAGAEDVGSLIKWRRPSVLREGPHVWEIVWEYIYIYMNERIYIDKYIYIYVSVCAYIAFFCFVDSDRTSWNNIYIYYTYTCIPINSDIRVYLYTNLYIYMRMFRESNCIHIYALNKFVCAIWCNVCSVCVETIIHVS